MKVKFGAIIVDGRNKIGGHVASKNHYGSYFRTKVTPSNPQTPAQSAARNRMVTISQIWKSLDAASISAWANALPLWKLSDIFGDSHNFTAIALFQKLNNNIIRAGGTPIEDPPVAVYMNVLGTVSVAVVQDTSVTITCTLQTLGSDEVLEVFATPDIPTTKRFVKSEYRLITSIATLTAGVYVATSAYEAKFGSTYGATDTRIYVKCRLINKITGQVTVPVSAYAES